MAWTNSDTIAACSAFIALLALASTIWSAIIQRRHNVLSLRPFMDITCHALSRNPIRFDVKNGGVGPAIVQGVSFVIDGTEYPVRSISDGPVIVGKISEKLARSNYEFHVPHGDGALVSGETLMLLSFSETSDNADLRDHLLQCINRIGVLVKYESVYGDKYTAKYEFRGDAP